MKKVLGICGSASLKSSNLTILKSIERIGKNNFEFEFFDGIAMLPHFQTEITDINVPKLIIELRNKIKSSDGIIICTPEYVVNIPSRLKNLIEWCISEPVFPMKPTGIITASANGLHAHKELTLIMNTLQVKQSKETTLLIQGVKGKIDDEENIIDLDTIKKLEKFVFAFDTLMEKPSDINWNMSS